MIEPAEQAITTAIPGTANATPSPARTPAAGSPALVDLGRRRRALHLDREEHAGGDHEAQRVQREREPDAPQREEPRGERRTERDPDPARGVVEGGRDLRVVTGDDRQRRAQRGRCSALPIPASSASGKIVAPEWAKTRPPNAAACTRHAVATIRRREWRSASAPNHEPKAMYGRKSQSRTTVTAHELPRWRTVSRSSAT